FFFFFFFEKQYEDLLFDDEKKLLESDTYFLFFFFENHVKAYQSLVRYLELDSRSEKKIQKKSWESLIKTIELGDFINSISEISYVEADISKKTAELKYRKNFEQEDSKVSIADKDKPWEFNPRIFFDSKNQTNAYYKLGSLENKDYFAINLPIFDVSKESSLKTLKGWLVIYTDLFKLVGSTNLQRLSTEWLDFHINLKEWSADRHDKNFDLRKDSYLEMQVKEQIVLGRQEFRLVGGAKGLFVHEKHKNLERKIFFLFLFLAAIVVGVCLLAIYSKEETAVFAQKIIRSLKISEERYKKIAEDQAQLLCRFDPNFILTFVNKAFTKFVGKSESELLGTNFLTLIDVSHRSTVHELFKQNEVNGNHTFSAEYNIYVKSELKFIFWTHSAIVDENSRVSEYQAFGFDLTEKIELEKSLEKLSNQSLDKNEFGSWNWDIISGEMSFNSKWYEMLGYNPAEVSFELDTWSSMIHEEDREWVMKMLLGHVKGESDVYEAEYRISAADGKFKWILDRGNITEWDINGEPLKASGTHLDITQKKRADEELKKSRLMYYALANTAPVGIFRTDPEGFCLFVNNKWSEYSGLKEEEALGLEWTKALHPDDRERINIEWQEAVRLGIQFKSEFRFLRYDGEVFWLFGQASPERDHKNKVVAYVGTLTDITQKHKIEEALVSAKHSAEDATKAKSQFLANMSHEIRTPMNGVLGMTELLLQTELTSEQKDLAQTVILSAESLLGLINDILDFSKIEAGKLELVNEVFDLDEFLNEIEVTHKISVGSKGIAFILQVDSLVPKLLVGDTNRLRQVLVNLVGNSLKFTPSGGAIVVQIAEEARTASTSILQFSVSDTGKGISSSKQREIFEAFSQEDSGVTREFGGTGLGLAISSQLVKLMNGDIGVMSEPGKGSVFYFTAEFVLPRQDQIPVTKKKTVDSSLPKSSKPLRVLLAEDNAVNRKLAVTILEKAGFEVSVAKNGQEAVELAETDTFDLILMDIQMPIMSGEEATKALREKEISTGLKIPIIALTAHAMEGDREKYLNLGMDGYVSKPIRNQELFAEIDSVIAKFR
ncbi:MAG: PAS domain S-box protein, partial [Bdellovibrionales bacterium]|nr:PAS domain S-box protein [Bdellovibrionales bacterium]